MRKFRKKPLEVEAYQMWQGRRQYESLWPDWLRDAFNKDFQTPGALYASTRIGGELCLRTHEGEKLVNWDDWIIQGVQGELYLCKPDHFEATYEPVNE